MSEKESEMYVKANGNWGNVLVFFCQEYATHNKFIVVKRGRSRALPILHINYITRFFCNLFLFIFYLTTTTLFPHRYFFLHDSTTKNKQAIMQR